jgi:hypothetical protein
VSKFIAGMPKENALDPNGFIGAFYHWDVVKGDGIATVQQLSHLRGSMLNLLNTANIVLLPKKEQVHQIRDYRPISLVYCVAKKIEDSRQQTHPQDSQKWCLQAKVHLSRKMHS